MFLRPSHDRTFVVALFALAGCWDFDAVTRGGLDAGRNDAGRPDAGTLPQDAGHDGAASGDDAAAPRCSEGFPTWVDTTTDSAVPPGVVVAGNEAQGPDAGFYPVYVCRVAVAGDVYPGKFIGGIGCLYTVDGLTESWQGTFQVLVDAPTNPCLTWQKGTSDTLPLALVGGIAGSTPLTVCRAFYLGPDGLDGTHAGYVQGDSCRITYKQAVAELPKYEVLITLLGATP